MISQIPHKTPRQTSQASQSTYSEANLNMLWASSFVNILHKLGVTDAVMSPGSRVAPMAMALGLQNKINTTVVLDERSAAFFALGLSKRTRKPTILVCTSGTAAANYFPAIIEASQSNIPLIVCTTDRPGELQDCHSPQTIDQVKLYGSYSRFYHQFTLPQADLFNYLRQTLQQAFEKSISPRPGPIHLNLPFRDPLCPIPEEGIEQLTQSLSDKKFLSHLIPLKKVSPKPDEETITQILQNNILGKKGLLVVGTTEATNPEAFSSAIFQLATTLNWPIISDTANPLRHRMDFAGSENLIATYDSILRNKDHASQLTPDTVIFFGPLPTSKVFRLWLNSLDINVISIEDSFENQDPHHLKTISIKASTEDFSQTLIHILKNQNQNKTQNQSQTQPQNQLQPQSQQISNSHTLAYLNHWQLLEKQTYESLQNTLTSKQDLFEGKIAWILSQYLPKNTSIFVANSMPIRDIEYFGCKTNNQYQFFFSRGANGIDGTLSTALGIAQDSTTPTVLLTGDLTFLHDINGLLIKKEFRGSLTVILINNDGGGIFEHLPIAKYDQFGVYERCIVAPQGIDFQKLVMAHDIKYEKITDWNTLKNRLQKLSAHGIEVIEIPTDKKTDAKTRKSILDLVSL